MEEKRLYAYNQRLEAKKSIGNPGKARKSKRRLKKHMRSLFLFSIIFILGFILFYRTGYAKDLQKRSKVETVSDHIEPRTEDANKLYKTIEIRQGDSLWVIAEQYMDEHYDSVEDYIQDLKDINHLETDCIEEGNYLTVTYYM